jgi:Flp pilus assembly protein TadG
MRLNGVPRLNGVLRRLARHDDTGATAIIVALTLSTVLLGVGALAVDLGNAFARRAQARGAADLAALAGARQLPSADLARRAALAALCANALPGWPAGVCTDAPDLSGPNSAWASNNDESDGEIEALGYDAGLDGWDTANDRTTGAWATAVRVVLPPSTVHFALSPMFGGARQAAVTRAATAALTSLTGAPAGLPTNILPISLLPSDPTPGTASFCATIDGAPTAISSAANCASTAQRGFIDEPYLGSTSGTLRQSMATGLDWAVHAYPTWPCVGGTAPLDSACAALPSGATPCAVPPLPAGSFVTTAAPLGRHVNCLRTSHAFPLGGSERRQLREGLIGNSTGTVGRLQRLCDAGARTTSVLGQTIDNSDLFDYAAPWANRAGWPNAVAFAAQVALLKTGQPNTVGAPPLFTDALYSCARFGVAPVLNLPSGVPADGSVLPVSRFRYVWIGGDVPLNPLSPSCAYAAGGVLLQGNLFFGCSTLSSSLIGVRGYLIDPSYLPARPAAGSPTTPYLGEGITSVVSLVHDQGDAGKH